MISKLVIVGVMFWIFTLLAGVASGIIGGNLRTQAGAAQIIELQDLYKAGMFDQVLTECDQLENNRDLLQYAPQLMFMRWAAADRLSRTEQAERIEKTFLQRYPQHPLVADMHFMIAVDLIAQRKYLEASRELSAIQRDFPAAEVAPFAADISRTLANSTMRR